MFSKYFPLILIGKQIEEYNDDLLMSSHLLSLSNKQEKCGKSGKLTRGPLIYSLSSLFSANKHVLKGKR